MMRSARAGAVLAAVLGAMLWLPAPSDALTTIGSDLEARPSGTVGDTRCRGRCTVAPRLLPGRARLASRVNGVIVRWRIRTGIGTRAQFVRLRVVRRRGGTSFRGVAMAGFEPLAALDMVQIFSVRLPIRRGDAIALDCCRRDAQILARRRGAATYTFRPRLADGRTRSRTALRRNRELLLNADVEADLDRDGYGDETQDACPGDGARQVAPCPGALLGP